MIGDGKFQWFYAAREDAERWYGRHATRDEAVAAGRAEFGPNESFAICEADSSVVSPDFDEDGIVEKLLESLAYNNCECWGEDGDGDAWQNEDDLKARLRQAVSGWLTDNPPSTYTFGTVRVSERIPALAEVQP